MSRILLTFVAFGFCLVLAVDGQLQLQSSAREKHKRHVDGNATDTEARKYGKVIKIPSRRDSTLRDSLSILYQVLRADPDGISQTMPWVENITIFGGHLGSSDENAEQLVGDFANGSVLSESDGNVAFYDKTSGSDLLSIVDTNHTVSSLAVFYGNSIGTAFYNVSKDVSGEEQSVTSAANYDQLGYERGKVSSEFGSLITSANQHIGKIEKNITFQVGNGENSQLTRESLQENSAKSETETSTLNIHVSFETTEGSLRAAIQESTSTDNSSNSFQSKGDDPTASNTLKPSTDATSQPTSIEHPHRIKSTAPESNITPRNLRNHSTILEDFRVEWPVAEWISLGFFTEEFLSKIPLYWLSFPPPSVGQQYALAGAYVLILLVGGAGNLLVIIMFSRCKSLKTPGNILVMNLAFSDLLLLLKMPIFIYNSIQLGPALGETGCNVYAFFGGLTGTVSIATLAAIGLDRYYVIVHPLDPLRRTTRLRARLCVAVVWLYGLVFAGLPLAELGFSRYVPEGFLTSCSFDYLSPDPRSRAFILVFFVAAWVVPFVVLTFSYLAICHVVVRARELRPDGDSSRHCRENDKQRTELRLASVVLGVVGLWFISWTPYAVVALLGVSGNQHLLSPVGSMLPALFAKMASAVDPYVYAINHPRFRQELYNLWHRVQGKPQFRASQARSMVATIRDPVGLSSSSSNSDAVEMNVLKPEQAEPEALGTPVELPTLELARQDGALLPLTCFRPPKPKRNRSTSLRLKSKVKDVQENAVFYSYSEMPAVEKNDVD